MQAICCVPLITQGRTFGTINLASRKPDAFTSADVELIQQVAAQVAIALENALAFKEIDALKDKLAVEKLYLEEEIRSEFNFDEIIGESPALRRMLAQVELAAPAGTTVAREVPAAMIVVLAQRRHEPGLMNRKRSASCRHSQSRWSSPASAAARACSI